MTIAKENIEKGIFGYAVFILIWILYAKLANKRGCISVPCQSILCI